MFTFVIASHDEEILQNNILQSDIFKSKKYGFVVMRDYDKCTVAYNQVLPKIKTPYVVYAHHGLQLSDTFEETLISSMKKLETIEWGVAGVAGVTFGGRFVGSCLSYGYPWGDCKLNKDSLPVQIKVLDELLLIKKNDGYLFDENIPYNHMYGTDVCLHYQKQGYYNVVVPIQTVNHNANRKRNPNEPHELLVAGGYIRNKYPQFMPTKTTCMTIK